MAEVNTASLRINQEQAFTLIIHHLAIAQLLFEALPFENLNYKKITDACDEVKILRAPVTEWFNAIDIEYKEGL